MKQWITKHLTGSEIKIIYSVTTVIIFAKNTSLNSHLLMLFYKFLGLNLNFRRLNKTITVFLYRSICIEKFGDTKGIIRICKLTKDRQHNGQMKKEKRTNNDLLHIKQEQRKAWRIPSPKNYTL